VPLTVPTTAGIPYSGATIAAWLNAPPASVTMALASPKSGSTAVTW
jgi:hypothetical protein